MIKLTPKAYGCDEERFVKSANYAQQMPTVIGISRYALPIQAVDTHRPKPKAPAPTVQIKMGRQYFTTPVMNGRAA